MVVTRASMVRRITFSAYKYFYSWIIISHEIPLGFFGGGHWGLVLVFPFAKQKFYCLNHTSKVIDWAELQTVVLPTSVSQVARIHGCLAARPLQKSTRTKIESF
jgi:hypothetical protein